MVSAKRFAQMAKKWQRMAALRRKRLARTTTTTAAAAVAKGADECCAMSVAVKGHYVMYTADGVRFEVPLPYLATAVFGELPRISREEFGFASDDGRITLPCDAVVVEYVMCLLRRNASTEVEKEFLSSMAKPCHFVSAVASCVGLSQHVAVC